MTDINDILKKLDISGNGTYKNHFYVMPIENSDEYAKVYSKLNKNAVNTEFPQLETNTNDTLTKMTTYFEVEAGGITYNLFLIGDVANDNYYLKIGEK